MTARDAVLAEFPRCEECANDRESWGECGDRDAIADEIVRLRTIETAARDASTRRLDTGLMQSLERLRATLTEAPIDGK